MRSVLVLPDLAFPVTVEQDETTRRFRVTYGLQVRDDLDYTEAAHEFGECVFHALACDARLDNSELLPHE